MTSVAWAIVFAVLVWIDQILYQRGNYPEEIQKFMAGFLVASLFMIAICSVRELTR